MGKLIALGLLVFLVVLVGCSPEKYYVCSSGETVENSYDCPKQVICGDDRCDSYENCPIDCSAEARNGKIPNCKNSVFSQDRGICVTVGKTTAPRY